jgi:hypothetical protein
MSAVRSVRTADSTQSTPRQRVKKIEATSRPVFLRILAGALVSLLLSVGAHATAHRIDGITFGSDPTLFVVARDVCARLGLRLGFDGRFPTIDGKAIRAGHQLVTGEQLIAARRLRYFGARPVWDAMRKTLTISRAGKSVAVVRGRKHTIVDKAHGILKAFQGRKLLLRAHITVGREGHQTPNGDFKVGPKERMHRSRLYHFAPMPWSVPIKGDIFIHGYSGPELTPSHGCIRLTTSGPNPAHWFYEWVTVGSTVTVSGKW